jgi:hypothetical protein
MILSCSLGTIFFDKEIASFAETNKESILFIRGESLKTALLCESC